MSLPQLIVLGDSHANKLVGAAQLAGPPSLLGGNLGAASRFVEPFFEAKNGSIRLDQDRFADRRQKWASRYGIATDRILPGTPLIVRLGTASATFYGHGMWKQFAVGAQGRRHVVSRQAAVAMAARMEREVLRFLQALRATVSLRAVVEAPAPQRRHRALQWHGSENLFWLDRVFRQPVRDWCQQQRVPLIVATDTIDDEGFLRPEFYGDDWSHGNALWGASVLEHLAAVEADAAGMPQRCAIAANFSG